jgi:hypothetical protein
MALSAALTPAWACFDDERLQQEVLRSARMGQASLVYVWSERMVYSVQQLPLVQQAASAAGLQFIALSEQAAACSQELRAREALRHFPTAFVITPEGVHRFPIVGAMPEAAWRQSIAQRLEQP